MLKARDRKIVRIFKQRIQVLTPVNRVVVFGSRARGTNIPESDLDVYVEIPEVTPELRQQIYTTAWEVGYGQGVVISTFLVSTTALIKSPLAANPILRVINEEGVAI